jgi:hypothetical protein
VAIDTEATFLTFGASYALPVPIVIYSSTDFGQTWVQNATLPNSTINGGINPGAALAKGPNNTLYFVNPGGSTTNTQSSLWTSSNNGKTWGNPLQWQWIGDLGSDAVVEVNDVGTLIYVYPGHLATTELDLFVVQCTRGGSPVAQPLIAAFNNDSVDDNNPMLAWLPGKKWVIVWSVENYFGTDLDIVAISSSNDGATWTSMPTIVNSFGANDTGYVFKEDLSPSLASNGVDLFMVIWSSSTDVSNKGTDFDLFFSLSSDGVSWTVAELVNNAGLFDSFRDDVFPVLSYVNNLWIVLWREQDAPQVNLVVHIAWSNDNGKTWMVNLSFNTTSNSIPNRIAYSFLAKAFLVTYYNYTYSIFTGAISRPPVKT